MILTVATFPRSGQHFLKEHLIKRMPVELEFTHNINLNNNPTLTVVRNPIDCISSWAAMVQYFYENDSKDESIFISNIERARLKYKKFYEYILKDIDIVIDYNFLNTDIDNIINYIGKKINVIPDKNSLVVKVMDELESKHVASSKKLKAYEISVKVVNEMDMSEEFELYNKTLEKAYPKFNFDVF